MSLRRFSTVRRASLGLVAGVAVFALAGCSQPADDDPASSIVRTTTKIAGAAVVGIERDTTTACPGPAPVDSALSGSSTHRVVHTAGTSDVPADPQRIVVLDSAALDAVCALGLWERVVGAATSGDGDSPQPGYLGTGISELPSVGPAGAPDVGRIAQAAPDVILGSSPATGELYGELSPVAPTVFVGSDPVYWKAQFILAGNALGRADAATAALEQYQADAKQLGIDIDAAQTQASVVRFGADTLEVEGPAAFAGQVLTDASVRRPAYQNLEGAVTEPIAGAELDRAEGDLIYAVLAGKDGTQHAEDVMSGQAWEDLEAAVDSRVFAVEGEVWNGNGLVAARAVLTDLRNTLNGYAG
ncbi:ABC transporter substrate-binding protein [Rhodococcus tibetensis]|uniref:ABC transporter substrate-binding protein n=1 Tax=Rhodococcus tibetensis TaxID=2965064 RepID=A0ABT1QBV9_9NOCA|nr:ABC transporter substrate-binding protein [Rhodococcus sp. FXJ9.536]MCQ4119220.1 ABC transporter substrate-binding protein [Rhodococcus sp. FXJ9.536]